MVVKPLMSHSDESVMSKAEDVSADSVAGSSSGWSFARRPFWLFSHVFALAVVVLFVVLGLWQLGRHEERVETNALITDRIAEAPLELRDNMPLDDSALEGLADLEYREIVALGEYRDPDYLRVVNRSQGGVAGEHVVALFTLEGGTVMAVNRGFVPVNADVALDPVADGPTEIRGWLRQSVPKGRFGVDDSREGVKIPRFNLDDVSERLGEPVAPLWLQLEKDSSSVATFPDPVPLPPLDDGPHLSYAAQWFIFATLGVLFYGALIWRQSRTGSRSTP